MRDILAQELMNEQNRKTEKIRIILIGYSFRKSFYKVLAFFYSFCHETIESDEDGTERKLWEGEEVFPWKKQTFRHRQIQRQKLTKFLVLRLESVTLKIASILCVKWQRRSITLWNFIKLKKPGKFLASEKRHKSKFPVNRSKKI